MGIGSIDLVLEHPEPVRGLYTFLRKLSEGQISILNPNDLEYLRHFMIDLIEERHQRADEIESSEVAEAAEIANVYFPITPYAILCIDGRVTITNRWGMFGGMKAGSIQMPAGDSTTDFLRDEEGGGLFLASNSELARAINEALEKDNTIVELLDSHAGCAAREQTEAQLGHSVKDHGLMADVLRKKEMAQAMKDFVEGSDSKKVIPIQGTFDPHSGFAYVGLEKDAALEYAKRHGGFTEEVLEHLAETGVIISTRKLAEEFAGEFEKSWDSFDPKPSWKHKYKGTALQIWKSITRMAETLLQVLKEKIKTTYGLEDGEELEMRTRLFFASAFNNFCNVHESEFNPDGIYLSGVHKESFVSVTPRDFRPFAKYMSFGVHDSDLRNLPRRVVFASGIVRSNRSAQRVEKDSNYQTVEEFTAAPVAVIVKEVLRDKSLTPKDWETFSGLDWAFMEKIDWMEMDDREFLLVLHRHNSSIQIGIPMQQAILNLKEKMKALYEPYDDSSALLIDGKLVALPVICDPSRRLRILIPFVKKGFKR